MNGCFSGMGVFLEKCLLEVSREKLSMVVASCEMAVVYNQPKLNVYKTFM